MLDKTFGICKLHEVSPATVSQAFSCAVPGGFLLRMKHSLSLHTLKFVWNGYWFWRPFLGLGLKGLNIIVVLEVLAASELATPVDYLV